MPDPRPVATARLVAENTVKAWAPCPPEHHAGVRLAFERALVLRAEFREEQFRATARRAAVPESVIEHVLADLTVEDKSCLRPDNYD